MLITLVQVTCSDLQTLPKTNVVSLFLSWHCAALGELSLFPFLRLSPRAFRSYCVVLSILLVPFLSFDKVLVSAFPAVHFLTI